MALLALALPIAASAGTIDILNQFGSISVSAATGIMSTQSHLEMFDGITPALPGHSLGFVNFFTGGSLTSGTLLGGGVFTPGAPGPTTNYFDVLGIGVWAKTLTGCPSCTNPVSLFVGSFVGPVDWTLTSVSHGIRYYALTGEIAGMLYGGRYVTGITTQDFWTTGAQLNQGIGHISIGVTGVTVPEPGTLGLLGTGLVGIAGLFRRKLIAS
ncbi:MAG TPA: PEP-CTERM sorting domain-containing protein [Terriglobales bacterium]